MMKSTMHPIRSLINEKYLQRVKNVQSLTASFHSRLPSNLHHHCWLVSLENNTLHIVTDSPERAAIIRYQQHEIIKQINEEFSSSLSTTIKKLKIKIDYGLEKITPHIIQKKKPSPPGSKIAKQYCHQMLDMLDKP